MACRSTLIKPPPVDPNKSAIENVLELTQLSDIGPDIYTNTRPLWHPPGARGIFGGAVIAQCLSAAQRTVSDNFTVHSLHCYFVLAGNSEIPIVYHVERVREGRSFATRTVQARQRGRPIFTTTMSFVREGSGGTKTIEHASLMPLGVKPPNNNCDLELPNDKRAPFVSKRLPIHGSKLPQETRVWQWIRARGSISDAGGFKEHLSALAYISDSYFIGTVARVHNIYRFAPPRHEQTPQQAETAASRDQEQLELEELEKLKRLEEEQGQREHDEKQRPEIGMMVSLDHTIFFHNPRAFRADEWMFTEMNSPWAGDGRGLVMQRIWSKDGILIATCVQEGLVRLKQDALDVHWQQKSKL